MYEVYNMEKPSSSVPELLAQIEELNLEIARLQGMLDQAGIDYSTALKANEEQTKPAFSEDSPQTTSQPVAIAEVKIEPQHARFFYSYFKGRSDVYSLRTKTRDGGFNYYSQCHNFWKYNVCPKRDGKKLLCHDCNNQNYKELTQTALMEHLIGKEEDSTDVIGIYPLLQDETCNFLVFDFDNHEAKDSKDRTDLVNTDSQWIDEVNALREICRIHEIGALVERSRSGRGAHVWIFFAEPIPAITARKFGAALLTKGAEHVNQKSFKSYDRMLPAQDYMPKGGLGNLIALPLQGQALKRGNSAFIDEHWNAYTEQWRTLRDTKKLGKQFVEEKTTEWLDGSIYGVLAEGIGSDKEGTAKIEPWKKQTTGFHKEDVEGLLCLTLANQIYVEKSNVKPRMQNRIRRLAAYSNPEFYEKQAMGFVTWGFPRIVFCGYDIDDYICIPRGCLERLIEMLAEANIEYAITDERQCGRAIDVSFTGELYPEQKAAIDNMFPHDCGILAAATAFGKTAVGAYMVAEKKTNTLVLVHSKEIMKNWTEDFAKFLDIRETPPEYFTKTGKKKARKDVVGRLYAGHNSLTGIVDVAMFTSLGKPGDVNPIVKDYGMVIMDECHHAAAKTAEEVLKEINARFVYGMTATPKRDDGHEKKMFMQLGAVRHRFTAKEKAKLQGTEHYVYPRFTRLINTTGSEWKIQEAYKAVRTSELRNKQVVSDVEECIANGRTPLVLTKFRDHAEILRKMLAGKVRHVLLLQGGRSEKERERIRQEMMNIPQEEPLVLVAIGQYIGEGFNFPRLDTMMLTTPISWEGNVEQYAGRLNRDYEGKDRVIVYDYVDSHIRVLERMYHNRLRTYKRIGFELCANPVVEKQQANAIFDSETYIAVYERDLLEASEEIIISSPGVNMAKVKRTKELVRERQEAGVRVMVLTLCAESYPEERTEKTKEIIAALTAAGIFVKELPAMYGHFAVIDKSIVWYGDMNLLSREKPDGSLMRVVSKEIAQELLEMCFGSTQSY
jgi:superfamily II DNA or RNA helicase